MIISLLLAMIFMLSMSVNIFAVDDIHPYNIVGTSVEQAVTK